MSKLPIGIGPLEGWTEDDFLDELKTVRAVVCSKASTFDERQEAISAAMALHMRCGDDEFSERYILPVIHEMKWRDLKLATMS